MTRPFVLAALASAVGLAPAFAGSPEPAPLDPIVAPVAVIAPTAPDWGGPYVGAQLGYGFGEFSLDVDDFDTDGVIGGLHFGYQADLGQWVVGGEVQYDFADLAVDSDEGSGTFEEIARLKLKGGYDLGRSLIYGTAGIAYANFDGIDGVTDIDIDDPGYTIGLGYDYRLSDAWSAGAEYQYHIFDDFGADENDVEFSTIHLRMSYHF